LKPEFQGFWIDGTFIPPGLFEYSHTDGRFGDIFVPRSHPPLTPDLGAFHDLLEINHTPDEQIDWLAE
jgi:hypothetical protein